MHQHGLDSIPQRDRAGVAGPASSAQLQHDNTILESPEVNVTSVLLDGGADSRLQKLLDHADDLLVVFVVAQRVLLATFLGMFARLGHRVDDRLAGSDRLSDQTEHFRLDVRPVGIAGLGHRNELGAIEDRGDSVDIQEVGGQWRGVRRSERGSRGEILEEGGGEAFGQNAVVRNEFQSLYEGQC